MQPAAPAEPSPDARGAARPRVAVLMPARDAERTVRAAVVSILRQTFRHLVLVVVDDGSRDSTGSILQGLADRDQRMVLVRGEGEGIARALNRGLPLCSDCQVVARMDADDVAHPRRIELQLAAFEADPTLVAVGSRVRLFPRRAIRDGMHRYAAWLNGLTSPRQIARDLLVESPIVHPAAAVRLGALVHAGGWRVGPFPEDYDLWLRLAEAGGGLANVPRTLLAWRESPGRLTRSDPRYALGRHVALKCAYLARTALAGRREVAVWGAGATGKAFAAALSAHGISVALFIEVDARKIGRALRGVPVISYAEAGRARGLPLLVAVGAPGARQLIRAELARQGFEELRDYWCVS